MALRKPLVLVSGQIQQLQSADTLNCPVTGEDIVQKTNGNAGTIVIGNVVYIKANNNIDLAKSDAAATTQVFGLVADTTILTTASGSVQVDGILVATTAQWDAVAGTTGGLTPGAVYYVDPTTAGKLTPTAPSTVGQFVIRVGVASSATDLLINPHPPILL